jgi:hypothetical protein
MLLGFHIFGTALFFFLRNRRRMILNVDVFINFNFWLDRFTLAFTIPLVFARPATSIPITFAAFRFRCRIARRFIGFRRIALSITAL